MNEIKLKTIEQVREFSQGTADVAFCIPADQPTLCSFVATVIARLRYFRLSKGERKKEMGTQRKTWGQIYLEI